jgi:hypothetical protein
MKVIYPQPGKKEQWIKAMEKLVDAGFMTGEELNRCLEYGGMPEGLLKSIKARMDLFWIEFKGN